MSINRWAYHERCEFYYCPGDCDSCGYADDDVMDEEVDDERETMAPAGEKA